MRKSSYIITKKKVLNACDIVRFMYVWSWRKRKKKNRSISSKIKKKEAQNQKRNSNKNYTQRIIEDKMEWYLTTTRKCFYFFCLI